MKPCKDKDAMEYAKCLAREFCAKTVWMSVYWTCNPSIPLMTVLFLHKPLP